MDSNQTTDKAAEAPAPSPAAPNDAASTAMSNAVKAWAQRMVENQRAAQMMHGVTSLMLESTLKIMDEERERLYQTGQTDCTDVRRNNGWLNTLFSGAGPVSYADLCTLVQHWKDGVAARRNVGGFQ